MPGLITWWVLRLLVTFHVWSIFCFIYLFMKMQTTVWEFSIAAWDEEQLWGCSCDTLGSVHAARPKGQGNRKRFTGSFLSAPARASSQQEAWLGGLWIRLTLSRRTGDRFWASREWKQKGLDQRAINAEATSLKMTIPCQFLSVCVELNKATNNITPWCLVHDLSLFPN